MPYNAKLLLKYDCHINVEICSTIRSVKYLYKYVYKGNDRTLVKVTNQSGSKTKHKPSDQKESRDEVQDYIDCRYISSIEAAYRLLEFSMHGRFPSVQPLMVHLPDEQYVVFDADQTIEQLKNRVEKSRKTTLRAWFENNAKELAHPLTDEELGFDADGKVKPRGPELLYHEYPQYYQYEGGKFKRRKNNSKWQLGRLHTANPTQGQRWYLRILLTHVRGATGYLDLLTYVDETGAETVFKCFKKRCIAEGLLKDDKEWDKALGEAAGFKMPSQLRRLFAMIVKECNPQNSKQLFSKYKNDMIEDMENDYRKTQPTNVRKKHISKTVIEKMYNSAMYEICSILQDYEVDLEIHELVKPNKSDCFKHEAQVIRMERIYDANECQTEYDDKLSKMNQDQKSVCARLIKAIYEKDKSPSARNLFFIDAPGGTVCFSFFLFFFLNILFKQNLMQKQYVGQNVCL